MSILAGLGTPGNQRAIWVEKAATRLAPVYRLREELKVGNALVSPMRSVAGSDIYRSMRDVKLGDLVLHLTDNEAFTGLSHAASTYREIRVGGIDLIVVPLSHFQELNPPLAREQLFAPPFGEALRSLADQGLKRRFYTRNLRMAQGAYLTPVNRALLEILDAAYESLTGQPINKLISS